MTCAIEALETRRLCIAAYDGLPPDIFDPEPDVPDFPSQEAAISLGSFTGQRNRKVSDTLASNDTVDLFKIKLSVRSKLVVTLSKLERDADLVLYDAQHNVVSSSGAFGPVDERIAKTLRGGTYYVAVYAYQAKSTHYDLRVTSSAVTTATKK